MCVDNFSHDQILLERVITKTFSDHSIALDPSDTIRAVFRSKLWRMGRLMSKLGTKKCLAQLMKWKDGPNSEWRFTVNCNEVTRQVLARKRSAEELDLERSKRRCLEEEVHRLQAKVHEQAVLITKNELSKPYLKKTN